MATAAPAGAFTSTYVSGAHGNWVFSGENNYCSRGTVMTLRPTVTGTASYPRSGQTIYMLPTVEWSSDGSHWYLYKTNEHWESLNVHGAGAARFSAQDLRVPGGGFYWRVAFMDFRWYVGGTQVGRVVNVFDRGNDGWGEYWARIRRPARRRRH